MKNWRVFFAFWVFGEVGKASEIVQAHTAEEARIRVQAELLNSTTFGEAAPMVYEVREATLEDLDEFADAD